MQLGATGNGILSIEVIAETSSDKTLRINMTDGTYFDFTLENGEVTEEQLDEVKELNQRILNNTPKGSTNTNPAYINDSADLPLNKFVLGGKTEQDSTTGKNKVAITYEAIKNKNTSGTWNNNVYTWNGVTFTVNKDLSITIGGTFSERVYLYISNGYVSIDKAIYKIYGCPTGGSSAKYAINADVRDNTSYINTFADYGTGSVAYDMTSFTAPAINMYIDIRTADAIGKTFYPMLLLSTETETDYEPYTGGIPSPNPTYPQEIENVKSENIYNLKKHLTDRGVTYTENADGSLTFNLTNSLNTNPFQFSSKDIDVSLSGIITSVTSNNVRLNLLNSNNEYISRINESTLKTENKSACKIQFDWSSMGTVTMKNIMLNKGATAKPYVPYNCIHIKKYNKNLVLEDVSFSNTQTDSRNYFNLYIYAGFPPDTATIQEQTIVSGAIISTIGKKNYTFVANKNYTIMRIRHSGSSRDFRKDFNCNLIAGKTYTISLNITGINPSVVGGLSFNEVQVEEGSTATSYIAHAEKTYNFPLSEGQKLMEDGTIEDKVVNPYIELILNGTETIEKYDSGQSSQYYKVILNRKAINTGLNSTNIFCNYYSYISNNTSYFKTGLFTISGSQDLVLCNSDINSVAEFKQDLANKYTNGTPVKLQYKPVTPDETDFTTEQQAVIDEIIKDGTYKEVTHYTAEASINPDMNIGYYKDLEIWVNNLINS